MGHQHATSVIGKLNNPKSRSFNRNGRNSKDVGRLHAIKTHLDGFAQLQGSKFAFATKQGQPSFSRVHYHMASAWTASITIPPAGTAALLDVPDQAEAALPTIIAARPKQYEKTKSTNTTATSRDNPIEFREIEMNSVCWGPYSVRKANFSIRLRRLLIILLLVHSGTVQAVAFADVDMLKFASGSDGYRILGGTTNEYFGASVSGIGDINGDGIDDVAAGSYVPAPLGRSNAGKVMVIYGHSTATAFNEVDAATFNFGTDGFQIYGAANGDFIAYFYSVATAGDVNGDNIGDMIVGARGSDPGGVDNAGAAYVIFGRSSNNPFPAVIDLQSFTSGAGGFKVLGASSSGLLGCSVSGAGDFNGDGFDDVIIGACYEDPPTGRSNAGIAYVIFGHSAGTAFSDIDGGTFVTGALGFRICGASAHDLLGNLVSSAGDVNGDGYDDVLVETSSTIRIAYVLFGHSSTATDVDLLTFTSGATGFRILGAAAGGDLGWSVSGAGDVNNDGYDDVIAGSPYVGYAGRTDSGAAYVIFGRRGVPAFTDIDLSTMVYGTLGFRIYGAAAGHNLGNVVSRAGDVNGDGIDDVLVTAFPPSAFGRGNCGSTIVIFGHSNRTTFPDIDMVSPLGDRGYVLYGAMTDDIFGVSVQAAGDVNHDGIGDFIVGAKHVDFATRTDTGAAYVVFGSRAPLWVDPSYRDVDMLGFTSGPDGFRILGAADGDRYGWSVSGIGDINGDDIDDVAVGSYVAAPFGRTDAGIVTVIYGHSTATAFNEVDPATYSFGSGGFEIFGAVAGDNAGYSIAAAGDVNGDGRCDMIVGAPMASPGGLANAGAAYVIFGRASNDPFTAARDLSGFVSGSMWFQITGGTAGNILGYSVRGAGNVNGDAYSDIIVGAHQANPSSRADAGAAYVIFGHSTATAFTDIASESFPAGPIGFRILGASAGDFTGVSVSGAGDYNGDGYDDVIVGAHGANSLGRINAGMSYVIFGQSGTFSDIDLLLFGSGATGFRILGAELGCESGFSVSGVGDLNSDGYDDVAVGARLADFSGRTDSGTSYVIFGCRTTPVSDVDLFTMVYGTLGFRIVGAAAGDNLAQVISAAGDVNGDGISDMMVSAFVATTSGRSNCGYVSVIFGHDNMTAFPDTDLFFPLGKRGYNLIGGVTGDGFGSSVRAAGDVNNDGIDDLIVGAYMYDASGRSNTGSAYVIFGSYATPTSQPSSSPSTQPSRQPSSSPSQWIDPSYRDVDMLGFASGGDGFRILGSATDEFFAGAVSGIGDINGDGIDDVAAGGSYVDPLGRVDAGTVMVIYGHSTATAFNEVDPLTYSFGAGGFRIYGAVAGDRTGYSVAGAGDVNGDGRSDMIVGALFASPGGLTDAGAAYVIFGRASNNPFPAVLDLLSFTSGADGCKVTGAADSLLGTSVSGAGDFNNDGFADIIVGAFYADPLSRSLAGTAYVIFGHSAGTAFTEIAAGTFTTGAVGFRIQGAVAGDQTGYSVSGAGDVNGDGFADVIVGASFANPLSRTDAGIAYVIFGHSGAFTDIDLLSFTSGATGFRILGALAGGQLGSSVSDAGDVNSDGYDDVVMGTYWITYSNMFEAGVYVIFGRRGVPAFTDIDLSTMVYGTLGFRIYGAVAGDKLAYPVSGAGDVNGDGIDDVLVGANVADPLNRIDAGTIVIIFGHSNRTNFADIDVLKPLGTRGYRIYGATTNDWLGTSIGAAGDINNDGIDDFIVGVVGAGLTGRSIAGAAYVIFGSYATPTSQPSSLPSGQPSTPPSSQPSALPTAVPSQWIDPSYRDVDMLGFTSGSDGFRVVGSDISESLGRAVSGIDDINGDGIDDIAVGSYLASPASRSAAGTVVVIYGHSSAAAFTEVDPLTYNFGAGGFMIYGAVAGDQLGYSMGAAGDVNGDGRSDMIVGAVNAGPGAAYVIFGRASNDPFPAVFNLASFVSGATGFKVTGGAADDKLGWAVSGAGDVNGDGFDDVMIGAPYADPLSRTDAGAVYLIFGHSTGTAFPEIASETFSIGSIGTRIYGAVADDLTGASVSCTGDVNGDGYDDIMIGAYNVSPLGKGNAGIVYVIFGHSDTYLSIDLLSFTSGATGFRILGAEQDSHLGISVSVAGDINNDGVDDILAGARSMDYSDRVDGGAAYVIFGHRSAPSGDVDLSTMVYGTLGFRIYGATAGDKMGYPVSGAGDVNGDGFQDVLIGSLYADALGRSDSGSVVVIFGHSNRTSFPDIDVLHPLSTRGYRIYGAAAHDGFGTDIAAAGDVNNDGIDDFIVGAVGVDLSGRSNTGGAYVIFGSHATPTSQPSSSPSTQPSGHPSRQPSRQPSTQPTRQPSRQPSSLPSTQPSTQPTLWIDPVHRNVDTLTLPSGPDGFQIVGGTASDSIGSAVSGIGDINGDGIDDVAVSGGTGASAVMVVYGHSSATAFNEVDPLTYIFGTGGFQINGAVAGDQAGWSVSGAGDVNQDGIGDMIIGAYNTVTAGGLVGAGAVYVIFGRANNNLFPPSSDLASLVSNGGGFKVTGSGAGDQLGWSVSKAGDVNGDSFVDLIVGAVKADPMGRVDAGAACVIFGHSTGAAFPDIDVGAFAANTVGFWILGARAGDQLGQSVSGAGDVNGDGMGDIIIGADTADPMGRSNAGIAYVIFGHSSAITDIDLLGFAYEGTGFMIQGDTQYSHLGISVSTAGDFNNDEYDDIVVGAYSESHLTTAGTGAAYVIFGSADAGWYGAVQVAELEYSTTGFRIYGAAAYDYTGFSVSRAGDVNGDSIDDLIIGAYYADYLTRQDSGAAAILFGRSYETADFSDIDLGRPLGRLGYQILGAVSVDLLGYSVSAAGDVNSDGIDDVIIGVPNSDSGARANNGAAWVIFGIYATPTSQPSSAPSQWVDPSYRDVDMALFTPGNEGFRMLGAAGSDNLGASVSGIGDINGDGIDDVAAGVRYADPLGRSNAGAVMVIYGHSTATAFSDVTYGAGSDGFQIYGAAAGGQLGTAVAAAGDVNGDGRSDMVIGLPTLGTAYVIFGRAANNPFPAVLDLQSFTSGSDGFKVTGVAADSTGNYVGGAGDFNGDGYGDVLVAAQNADPFSRVNAGTAFMIFGHSTGTAFAEFDTITFVAGTLGFRIHGAANANKVGTSLNGAGDYNGDGFDDIITGEPYASPLSRYAAGVSYVIFGRTGAFSDIDLLSFTSGTTGFRILGDTNWQSGATANGAGDVNSDGFDDVVIGAPRADYAHRTAPGAACVIFGRRGVPAFTDIDLRTMVYGTLGFRVFGAGANDLFGYSVGGAGDVNGDGVQDILIGARTASGFGRSECGSAVIIFGHSNTTAFPDIDVLQTLGELGYRIYGAGIIDHFASATAAAGDVNNDGIDDFIIGAYEANRPGGSDAGVAYVIFGSYATPTSQPSSSPSIQPSRQPSSQPSQQPSRQPSTQPSSQPATQPSSQPSTRPSRQPSACPTVQPSAEPTVQPTHIPSAQPSSHPSRQPSTSPSAQPSRSPSGQPSSHPSAQPSNTPSTQPSVRPSAQPSSHPSRQPSAGPSSQPSKSPSRQPSAAPTAQPTELPSRQPSALPSSQPITRPTSQPSMQPSDNPSAQPSDGPSVQPSCQPSARPSTSPTGQPSCVPSSQPSAYPSNQPSAVPSCQPSAQPSGIPSSQPSSQPSQQPSSNPTAQPSSIPSTQPSSQPSSWPTSFPTVQPSSLPTMQPSMQPSSQPSSCPSSAPSSQPSSCPSCLPSGQPTAQPSTVPSTQPSRQPSSHPSVQPSSAPSMQPSRIPTSQPSSVPTSCPSAQPSSQPSHCPSAEPTAQPSLQPSSQPSTTPTAVPSTQPSGAPSLAPSGQPSAVPSGVPSAQPASYPSRQPTSTPSAKPSAVPSVQPSSQPASAPSSQPTTVPSVQFNNPE